MKLYLSFLFLVVGAPLFSQDPGTVIDIHVGSLLQKNFNVQIAELPYPPYGGYNGTIPYQQLKKSEDSQRTFHYFEWQPYSGSIYDILITSDTRKMQIRFRLEADSFPDASFLNAYFNLSIPFQPGYFEVTSFEPNQSGGYDFSSNYIWVEVPLDKRKLM